MGGMRNIYRKFGWKIWRKGPLGRRRHRWEDNIRMDLREIGWTLWTGFILLIIGTGGGFLWTQYWTFGFCKWQWISWLAVWLFASQGGLCSMELGSWLVGQWTVRLKLPEIIAQKAIISLVIWMTVYIDELLNFFFYPGAISPFLL